MGAHLSVGQRRYKRALLGLLHDDLIQRDVLDPDGTMSEFQQANGLSDDEVHRVVRELCWELDNRSQGRWR